MTPNRSRQMKYLWAIGALNRDAKGRFASKNSLRKVTSVEGTKRQITREIGKVGASLSVGEQSKTHQLRIGDKVYPIQKDRNGSSYPAVNGKTKNISDLSDGPVSIERIKTLDAKRLSPVKTKPSRPVQPEVVEKNPFDVVPNKTRDQIDQELRLFSGSKGTRQSIAFETYQGFDEYAAINNFNRKLPIPERSNYFSKEELVDLSNKIDTGIREAKPLSKEIKVYRWVDGNLHEQMQEGDFFQDEGFMSTSVNPRYGDLNRMSSGGSIMEIVLPRGSRGIHLDSEGKTGEDEILLNRDSILMIDKRKSLPGGKWFITARLHIPWED